MAQKEGWKLINDLKTKAGSSVFSGPIAMNVELDNTVTVGAGILDNKRI